jgi:hypothetical protein
MKLLMILAAMVCVALFIAAPTGNAQAPAAKYQIVAAAQGGHAAVFKLDTTTGAVSFCFPHGGNPQPSPATAVRCVAQDR